jgi:hypothetical protein
MWLQPLCLPVSCWLARLLWLAVRLIWHNKFFFEFSFASSLFSPVPSLCFYLLLPLASFSSPGAPLKFIE